MDINIAVVPAAELGTRLLPATKSHPKEMLSAGRKPVVQYVVDELTRVGMNCWASATRSCAELAAWGLEALLNRDTKRLAELINENFDTRRSVCNLPSWQVQMVEVARQCGASAKFAGSGGAIIGTCQDERMYEDLSTKPAAIGSCVFKPEIE